MSRTSFKILYIFFPVSLSLPDSLRTFYSLLAMLMLGFSREYSLRFECWCWQVFSFFLKAKKERKKRNEEKDGKEEKNEETRQRMMFEEREEERKREILVQFVLVRLSLVGSFSPSFPPPLSLLLILFCYCIVRTSLQFTVQGHQQYLRTRARPKAFLPLPSLPLSLFDSLFCFLLTNFFSQILHNIYLISRSHRQASSTK